jgi:hypothetical protein
MGSDSGYDNHPLNFERNINIKTKYDFALSQMKEFRGRQIADSLRDYLEQTMSNTRLEYIQDNMETLTKIFEERQEDVQVQDWCSECSEKAKKKCSICFQEMYCSKSCQISHWNEHKKICHYMGMMRLMSYGNPRYFDALFESIEDEEANQSNRRHWKMKFTEEVIKFEVEYQMKMKDQKSCMLTYSR